VLPVRYELDCQLLLQVASISQLTVSRLSRQCGSVTSHNPIGLHCLLGDSFILFILDYLFTVFIAEIRKK
jgi:hypothetical protein